MRQISFIRKSKTRHGGVLTLKRRKVRRHFDIRRPIHIVLRSDLAKGSRSLVRNQKLVEEVLYKFAKRFRIRIYEKAVCGNHIHCLVRGKTRIEMQNFFRVLAGQIGQGILRRYPLRKNEKKAHRGGTHPKSQKSFWSLLLFSRVVSWGWDFNNVKRYVIQNTLETLGIIPYQLRKTRFDERLFTTHQRLNGSS